MAAHFAARGLVLGLCSRGAPALTGEAVVAHELDVADDDAVARFAHEVEGRFGHIDLWINNAGVLEPVVFVRDLVPAAFERHWRINVGGVLNGSRAYLRHLHASGRAGVLVNISSGAALKGYAGWGAYCAAKAAVDRLSECMALEEQAFGTRVYAVAPGVIDTAMQQTIRGMSEEQFPMVAKFVELKANEAFNSPSFVAEQLLAIAFDPARRPDAVVTRLEEEPRGG
jgi:benzil reductase ((S)-benzoin forming)